MMNELFIEVVASVVGAVVGAFVSWLIIVVTWGSESPSNGSAKVKVWWVLIVGIIIGSIGGYVVGQYVTILPITMCEPQVPTGTTIDGQFHVHVPADQYWFDTGINVKKGDWLHFTAEGKWWSGISETGPDGDKGFFGFGRPSCGQCPVVGGNLGELVGKVEGSFPFRIGRCRTENMHTSGTLLLAMNETTGPCKNNRPGSCYDDNEGALSVEVTIWRIK